MDGLLNFGATIIVAIIGLVGIVIQTKSKEKIEHTNSKIDELRKESKVGDDVTFTTIDNDSTWLTVQEL